MKVMVIGNEPEYVRMFVNNGFEVVKGLDEADLVQFTGGADVSPELYKEKNVASYTDSVRDAHEAKILYRAVELGKGLLGICRGGQFLNVMSGHLLWQDVDNHAVRGTHEAELYDGSLHQVSSTHHQMFRLREGGPKARVLLTAKRATKKMDELGVHPTDGLDLESVFHPHTKALSFQPHPEFFDPDHECQKLYFRLIKECFEGD